ncbi:hypothetical protein [Sphingobium sp. Ant17]|uniref:hypothetical protein n=1 Tax=Sphingobium sp. Ant17 TaxID=1461752 RepID=UPI0004B333F1|nr:hypothetical protein [Sphingobium sp. Ant17]
MRVMLFLKGFGPGGVERIALRLGDGLRRTGCDLTVIVAAATGPMDNPLGQACLVAQPWPVIGMRWPLLRLAYSYGAKYAVRHPRSYSALGMPIRSLSCC